jgi:predicted PolB exonuclease-like 3'-5' exonuclease
MYEVPGQTDVVVRKEGNRTMISGTEKQILEKFWEFFDSDSRFISFNGRQFDGPFLMIRSAVNGVLPKRDLVGYRYGFHPNCDIREALNFFGTTNNKQFKFNLDLACKLFGVETSKSEGIDGRSVESWYRAGRHREIADYCLEDVRATAQLYEKLAPTLLVFNKEFRESEARAQRMRAESEQQLTIVPLSESSFMESVTQTSISLTNSLADFDSDNIVEPSLSPKHHAAILEKLAASGDMEEEIPAGI